MIDFTEGSIPFAGISGFLKEDNSNLFFDDNNNQLQLGNGSATFPSLSFKSNTSLGLYLNSGIVATKDIRITSIGMLNGLNAYAGAGCYISGTNDWTFFQNSGASLTFESTGSIARFQDRSIVIGLASDHPATGTTESISLRNQKGLYWRNAANTADLSLIVDSSDKFDFTGGGARYPVGYILLATSGNGIQIDTTTVSINIPLALSALISKYNNITTVGWGVPAIYGKGRLTAQTAAVAVVATYTVGANDGSFLITSNINVTAYTAGTITVACDYTDETNTPRTFTFTFSSLTGTLLTAIGATGPYGDFPAHIRCKASTSITIKTTISAWTGTYNVEGYILQIGSV